jgi:zinc protease
VRLPPPPDISEPRQAAEKRKGRVDSLATRPALAVGWHMPPRWTREWFAMGLIDQVLAQGRDARFHDAIVQQKGWAGDINAGINAALGNQFNYEGPMLWMTWLFHDASVPADSILAAIDREVAALQRAPVDGATLARARVKMRSSLYDILDGQFGLGRLDLLASFTLLDNDPGRINQLEAGFQRVTPADIQRTAREYLRRDNRTVYLIEPGARAASGAN